MASQEMTFDDPEASMDCGRKRAHTEKAVNGSERIKVIWKKGNYQTKQLAIIKIDYY